MSNFDHGPIDLYDDDQVTKVISAAAAGDESAAWWLVHQIETSLRDRRVSPALFDYAAEFFCALLNVEDDEKTNPKELAKAFKKLHIVRRRGRQTRSDQEKRMLASRVILLNQAGYSVDTALGALEDQEIVDGEAAYPRSAYKEAYYEVLSDTGESVAQQLERVGAELEALAGVNRGQLVDSLIVRGRLTLAKK